jgi:opacity protein-like surface antigen
MAFLLASALPAHAEPSRFYVSLGAGVNWASEMDQKGHNDENTCYPTNDCAGRNIDGYRWFYDLDTDAGGIFEAAAGYKMDNIRLELALNWRKNDIDQKFKRLTYLDGSTGVRKRDSNYTNESGAAIDDIETTSIIVNAYYDFPLDWITPYVGAGIGLSRVELTRVSYSSKYSCSGTCNAPLSPPSAYNARQKEDFSDTVLSGHFHAGADYDFNDNILIGLKLSYSIMGDMRDSGSYSDHSVPETANHTKIEDIDHFSIMLGLKHFF